MKLKFKNSNTTITLIAVGIIALAIVMAVVIILCTKDIGPEPEPITTEEITTSTIYTYRAPCALLIASTGNTVEITDPNHAQWVWDFIKNIDWAKEPAASETDVAFYGFIFGDQSAADAEDFGVVLTTDGLAVQAPDENRVLKSHLVSTTDTDYAKLAEIIEIYNKKKA